MSFECPANSNVDQVGKLSLGAWNCKTRLGSGAPVFAYSLQLARYLSLPFSK